MNRAGDGVGVPRINCVSSRNDPVTAANPVSKAAVSTRQKNDVKTSYYCITINGSVLHACNVPPPLLGNKSRSGIQISLQALISSLSVLGYRICTCTRVLALAGRIST